MRDGEVRFSFFGYGLLTERGGGEGGQLGWGGKGNNVGYSLRSKERRPIFVCS